MTEATDTAEAHDVFVSYRQKDPDKRWVREILVPALDAAGLDVYIDFRSFELGVSVIENMAHAVDRSRYAVAVMSPAYFDSGFTELERVMAQHVGLEKRQRRLIGLMLEECAPPTELRPFLWLDVSEVDDVDSPELQRLIAALSNP